MGVFGKLFGNKQNEDNVKDSNYVETIIKSSKDEPLAVSNTNVMYAGYNELGGYYYLQTYIMGAFKIKTKTGAKLHINGNDYTFDLKSDMDEFESEGSPFFDGYVTQIDFEIEKESVEKIKRSTIKEITLTLKKKTIEFSVYNKEE